MSQLFDLSMRKEKRVFYKTYEQPEEHLAIARLDPLQCDKEIAQLPAWNKSGDVLAIAQALRTFTPGIEQVQYFSVNEACAALRDLGMLMMSLQRHGVPPVTAVPEAVPIMLELGRIADMVPRETIMHYGVWNPDGERQRCFTMLYDEVKIIQGTKMGIPGLERAIHGIVELYAIPVDSAEFSAYAKFVQVNLSAMVNSIVYTVVHTNPRIFALELRPYYDPFVLNGVEYMGAGAVQLPVFIFDHILWSAESKNQVYTTFKEHNLPYCTPGFRALFQHFSRKPSLVQKTCNELRHTPKLSPYQVESVKAIHDLLDVLIRFRTPHKSLANRAFAHRSDEAVGSGGYRPSILEHILDLTLEAKHDLRCALYLRNVSPGDEQ